MRFFFRCNVVYSPPGKQQAAARSVVASRAATREELSNLSSRNPHLHLRPFRFPRVRVRGPPQPVGRFFGSVDREVVGWFDWGN